MKLFQPRSVVREFAAFYALGPATVRKPDGRKLAYHPQEGIVRLDGRPRLQLVLAIRPARTARRKALYPLGPSVMGVGPILEVKDAALAKMKRLTSILCLRPETAEQEKVVAD